jgi:hypothetical protein
MEKRTRNIWLLVVFWVAAVVCCGGGCASLKRMTLSEHEKSMLDSFHRQVHDSVSDPVRAEQLIEVGDDVAMALHDYFNKMAKMVKKVSKANADYDTTPEQLASYFLTLDKYRRNIRKTLLQANAQALALTTESEWRALSNRKNSLKDFLEKHPELF